MPTYEELVTANKDEIIVQIIKSIDDKSLTISYSFQTNLHADWGISKVSLFNSASTSSKKKARKLAAMYKQATGKKFKLTGTSNSLGFTRLIYTLG